MKTIICSACVWLGLLAALPVYAEEYETPQQLPLKQLAPQVPALGPGYQISEPVAVHEYYGHYELRSDVGNLKVDGADLLAIRIAELEAVRRLDALSRSDVFVDAAKRGVERPVEAVRQVGSKPVDTLAGLPAGVGRFLVRSLERAKDTALDITDAARDAMRDEDDAEGESQQDEEGTGEKVTRATEKAALRYIGYQRARRELARELAIDPYSSNPLLRERLDELAWAAWAGGKTVGFGLDAVLGGVTQTLVGLSQDAYKMVWELPPEELRKRNLEALDQMGIRGKPARDFMRSDAFTLSLATDFVLKLQSPLLARDRIAWFRLALSLQTEREARFLLGALSMLMQRAEQGGDGVAIELLGRIPGLYTRKGQWVIAMPVDHVYWSEDFARFAWRDDLVAQNHELLVSGSVSERAREALSQAGWRVREGLR